MWQAIAPLWRFCLFLAFAAVAIIGSFWLFRSQPWVSIVVFVFIILVALHPLIRLHFRLFRYALSCRTEIGEGFNLHFPAAIRNEEKFEAIFSAFSNARREVAARFGFDLPRAVAIYLFDSESKVHRVAGNPLTDALVPRQINAVLCALNARSDLIRHELAHLFAQQIGPDFVPFKCEGLAVWVEWNGQIPAIDKAWLEYLRTVDLRRLLLSYVFSRPATVGASYIVAGHFTDFLIRRFGWQTYLTFYKRARVFRFFRGFEEAFGITFKEAESQWRTDLQDRYGAE